MSKPPKTYTLTTRLKMGQVFELAGIHYRIKHVDSDDFNNRIVTAEPAHDKINFTIHVVIPRGTVFAIIDE